LFIDRTWKRITEKSLSRLLKYIGMKTGSRKISGHSLRKFHRTRLEGAGMPEGWVKRLQGKKASVYSHPEETGELTEKYVDCYHALRIFGEQASTQQMAEQATEIERLRQENEGLREQMARQESDLRRDFEAFTSEIRRYLELDELREKEMPPSA